MMIDPSPGRITQYGANQLQQAKNLGNVYQSKETGKIYHLSRKTDKEGNNVMVSTAYGGQNYMQSVNMEKRRSDPRDNRDMVGQIEALALNQTAPPRKNSQNQQSTSVFSQGNNTNAANNGGTSARNEFISQLNQLRQSHAQQAVQPMIFNFFNAKSDSQKKINNQS